jgi:hypothetical protein
MMVKEYLPSRHLVARLDKGLDLVEQITDLASGARIEAATFMVIGALRQAELSYYDQEKKEYHNFGVDGPMELVSCNGNVSIRDSRPFVHAHAVLSDLRGNVVGGHLIKALVFAAELYLIELSGEKLVREFDAETGLYLWRLH